QAEFLPAPLAYRRGPLRARLDAHAYRLPGGRVVTIFTDVTERESAEEDLHREWDRLEMVTRNVGVGLALVSPDYRVLWGNEVMRKLFGDIVGRRCHERHDGKEGADCPAAAVFATGVERDERERMSLSPEGKPVWTQVISSPLRDADGNIIAVLEAVVPVTERKQLEEQLRQAQKMEAVGRLAGGMAHDFNNLLTAIMGYAELLEEDVAHHRGARHRVQEILRSTERAATLTRQLLAFSRRQVLAPKVIDINETVKGVATLIQRLIGEDIVLRIRPGSPLGLVKVDPVQLEQVLLNLAVNARDAMPGGGTLTISTRDVKVDTALAGAHPDLKPGPAVRLEVSDTGHGMDAETLSRAFEPFFTTKLRGRGTGLGLSMVFGIVKQSGGDILVESSPGRGTTFRIYLPSALEPKTPEPVPAAAAAAPGGSETVLLVEDDRRVRELASHILRAAGYTVLPAADALQAERLAAAQGGPIQLLVTDIVMARVSGPQLAQRLAPKRPGLKILYISGYAPETVTRHIQLAPGIAFLAKPFTRDALLRKARETLDAPTLAKPKT
ncbi:MAG: ATP-binding protein, partial [Elusimicrobia bacterium]|nr:ATP-binding protein [Elusimicrobiota bacterium]